MSGDLRPETPTLCPGAVGRSLLVAFLNALLGWVATC